MVQEPGISNQAGQLITIGLVVLYIFTAGWLITIMVIQDRRDQIFMDNLTQAELDRKTIEQFVQGVLDNPRLAREIVKAWLNEHNLKIEKKPDNEITDLEEGREQ